MVEVNTHILSKAAEEEEDKPERASPFDSLNFHSNDIDWDGMSEAISQLVNDENLDNLHPNERLSAYMKIFIEVCYKFVPAKKTSRRGSFTKIPRERRILMRKRRKLMQRLECVSSKKQKNKIREKLIKVEMLLQQSHREGMTRKEQLAVKSIKTNPKYFFTYAKQFSTTRSKIGPLLTKLNEYTSNSSEMAEILSTQYSSVFSKPSPSPYDAMVEDPDIPTITDIDITEEDIIAAIDELSNTSTSGPDGLTAIFLKKCKL